MAVSSAPRASGDLISIAQRLLSWLQRPHGSTVCCAALARAGRSSRRQCADLRRTILHAIFPILLLRWSSANAQVTDIALQEGEKLVGPGPVAAGDTVRWMIGDTLSGTGATARVHILVKPTRPDIATNLVINTDRRTYHVELRANPSVYMASVSWSYPADELIALRRAEEDGARAAPVASGFALENLNFDYRISGDRPDWRPVRIFDDGQRTLIEFPPDIAQGEMPPFFVIGEDGQAELVNYRVSGRYLIVDRLFEKAELRLGARRRQVRVKITNRAWGRS
ncbi:P-type conjugative transfer protein TrbG [Qipengyuania sp. Mu-71]|uniref:P-type conjugative transfer protein TrbG n=1 Tax=Qipengyuania sp. Mu-71 TaxID=3121477 RepID=UPI003FA7B97C